jgi:hypothetical protein
MERARRHQRLLSGLAFVLLALVAELVGRSLTHNLNVGRHVDAPSYAGADYYPFLLAAVKGGIALLLSRLAWRFVRAHAAARAGRRVLEAVGANANHGLRRSSADKRRSVLAMLRDPEWSGWSDREIGKRCAVDHKTVAKVRSEITGDFPGERTFITRHGTVATMTVQQAEAAPTGGSMVERMLSKATTEALIAECRRRGLEVSGHAD